MLGLTNKSKFAVVGAFAPGYKPGNLSDPRGKLSKSDENEQEFHNICKALGKALAKAGHTVVLYVPSWSENTTDESTVCDDVLNGVLQASKDMSDMIPPQQPNVILSIPPDSLGENSTSMAAKVVSSQSFPIKVFRKPRYVVNGYYPETYPSIREADAIILVSGSTLSEMVASAAHYVAQKPVITITACGGAAKAMYNDIFRAEYEKYESDPTIAKHLTLLHNEWNQSKAEGSKETEIDQWADEIISFTEQVLRFKRRSDHAEARQRNHLLRSACTYLTIWTFFFCVLVAYAYEPSSSGILNQESSILSGLRQDPKDKPNGAEAEAEALPPLEPLSFWQSAIKTIQGIFNSKLGKLLQTSQFWQSILLWLMLYLTASMGILLRTSVAYESKEIIDLKAQPLVISQASALILALGLGLIYFISGWSFSGTVKFPDEPNAVIAAAVAMSILGLTGGLLLPAEELRTRLRQFITTNEGNNTT